MDSRERVLRLPAGWAKAHRVEVLDEDAHARRLAVDAGLQTTMQLEASVGKKTTWNAKVRPDLWEYGMRVLPTKIIRGEIFKMMADVNGPRGADLALPAVGPDMTMEEAHDLASDVVEWAIERFHPVVIDKWDATAGATFRTFFVGKCSHGFAGVYRRWLRRRKKLMGCDDLQAMPVEKTPTATDKPETSAITRIQIDHYMEGLEGGLEEWIVCLDALEYSDKAIAEMLGVTTKVVEYRLRKSRLSARRRWETGKRETVRGDRGRVA